MHKWRLVFIVNGKQAYAIATSKSLGVSSWYLFGSNRLAAKGFSFTDLAYVVYEGEVKDEKEN